eukprot:Gb_09544 [translate_table: standard]
MLWDLFLSSVYRSNLVLWELFQSSVYRSNLVLWELFQSSVYRSNLVLWEFFQSSVPRYTVVLWESFQRAEVIRSFDLLFPLQLDPFFAKLCQICLWTPQEITSSATCTRITVRVKQFC